jgi:MocE subfamily Rieske [2Fe-2S] domain protein
MVRAAVHRDYSLVGRDATLACERGLAEAAWYVPPVSTGELRQLLERRNWPAIRDITLWFALIIGSGLAALRLWNAGSAWAVVPFMIYGVLYASTSDSRWHESGHGTAFKTRWLNDALYEIASFMIMRESTIWRWSHARHHSDTIIVGRDPEIAVPRPPNLLRVLAGFCKLPVIARYFWHVVLHCTGTLTPQERTFVPQSERRKVFLRAVIYLLIYAGIVGLSIYSRSILPLLFVGLPTLYGSWLVELYGLTQHAGLAEDVLDHRLNTRTIYMNAIHRYLYWNMNYHVEHHLFPLVPYYNLPRLHQLVRSHLPVPYRSLWAAWRELMPLLLRQSRDPSYCLRRELPAGAAPGASARPVRIFTAQVAGADGWIEVCAGRLLEKAQVIRFDHEGKTYAIYRTEDGSVYATAGRCTHGGVHLAEGLVRGRWIECRKHNGCFDIADGSPQRAPACVALSTYAVRELHGNIGLNPAGTPGDQRR